MGSKSKWNNKKSNTRWLITIIILSIIICGSISLLSDVLLKKVNILVAFIILIFIIVIGIIFDMIGILIGAFTIGGKLMEKNLAINKSNDILFKVCKILYLKKRIDENV